MQKVNVQDAKTYLSRYLRRVARGETILVCVRNVPVAELRPVAAEPGREPRRIGCLKGQFEVPPSFFEPLPDGVLDLFEGKGE